jgi:hypothetical protein
MGVTYKLKDEIVEFIIQQKKDNPRLSCRGLVEVIQDRFQTPVSKSSINSVIKNASLSNPVGRTPLGERKERAYKLPVEKKFTIQPPKSASPKVHEPLPPPVPKEVKTVAHPPKIKTADVAASHPRFLYDGIGSIFLKAAEWEIGEKSILRKLLEGNFRPDPLLDVDTGCDVLLYSELFGIKSIEEIAHYHKQGLWVLNGLKNRLDPNSLTHILEEVKDLKKLSLKISYEIPQIFAHVHALRLLLEDGSALSIDAELTSLWPQAVKCPAYVSLNQAISLISKQLLNNSEPCIFSSVPGAEKFAPEFQDLLMAFENLPGKRIRNIAVLDSQQQEIAAFDTIPHQRRQFIAGVWPWQKEFGQFVLAETLDGEKITTIPPFKSKVYYSELADPFPKQKNSLFEKLHVILLRESPTATPYLALVTNGKTEHWSAEEVVASYLAKWPNEIRTPHLYFIKEQGNGWEDPGSPRDFSHLESNLFTLVYGIPGIWEIIHSVMLALNVFCQRHFFPPGYGNMDLDMMKEQFYHLNGYLWPEGNFLFVKLLPPSGYLYKNDLEYAMRRVNEKGICDLQGRRLIFQF